MFIVIEFTSGGTNGILGIAGANSMNLFGVTTYSVENEYDYSLLEIVSSVLKNAEYNDDSNSLSVFEKVDMSGFSTLAQ